MNKPTKPKKRGLVQEEKLRKLASRNGSLFYEVLMLKEAAARCMEPSRITTG